MLSVLRFNDFYYPSGGHEFILGSKWGLCRSISCLLYDVVCPLIILLISSNFSNIYLPRSCKALDLVCFRLFLLFDVRYLNCLEYWNSRIVHLFGQYSFITYISLVHCSFLNVLEHFGGNISFNKKSLKIPKYTTLTEYKFITNIIYLPYSTDLCHFHLEF